MRYKNCATFFTDQSRHVQNLPYFLHVRGTCTSFIQVHLRATSKCRLESAFAGTLRLTARSSHPASARRHKALVHLHLRGRGGSRRHQPGQNFLTTTFTGVMLLLSQLRYENLPQFGAGCPGVLRSASHSDVELEGNTRENQDQEHRNPAEQPAKQCPQADGDQDDNVNELREFDGHETLDILIKQASKKPLASTEFTYAPRCWPPRVRP